MSNFNSTGRKTSKIPQKSQQDSEEEQILVNGKKSKINFKTFEPKDNIFYCFFIEPKRPTQKRLKRKKQRLFKIDYIEDIQRFCYYPGTTYIYTFLGFQSEDDRAAAMYAISLKSSMINRRIDIYSPIYLEKTQKKLQSEMNIAPEINQINTEKVKNTKTQNIYELSYFLFIDTFKPNDDLFYLFFEEKTNLSAFTSSVYLKDQVFGESLISEIQQFVYLPNTQQIFTFLGFLTLNELENAINNPVLKRISNISLYFEDSIITPKNDHLKVNKIGQDAKNDLYKKNNFEITFEEFVPMKNVIYIYFIERRKPDTRRMRSRNRPIRQITRSIDVQRYSYYPGTKDIYSFFGFRSKRQYKSNINNPNLQSASIDGKIYLYLNSKSISKKIDNNEINLITPKTINNISTNYLNYSSSFNLKEFEPKENIIYLYFVEIKSPKIHSNMKPIKAIKNAFDVQRFCCFPGTDNVYSFFGFLNQKQVLNAVNDHSLQSISLTKQFFIYFKFSYLNEIESSNIKNMINDIDFEFKQFVPIDDLVYFYFDEKLKSQNFPQVLTKSIKGIKNTSDIQRFCFYPGTQKVYSFFGFSSKEILLNSIENSNFKLEEIFQLKLYQPSSNDSHSNIATIKVVNTCFQDKTKQNANSTEVINETHKYQPNVNDSTNKDKTQNKNKIEVTDEAQKNQPNANNSMNQDKSKKQNSKSEQNKVESNDTNSDYSSLINELIQKQQNKSDIKNKSTISNQSNTNKKLEDLDIYEKQIQDIENQIDSSKLPFFNDYTNTNLQFNKFVPKNNLFYCFIAEKIVPNNRILHEKNKKLFKIKSASEIQRFCYYPGTKNVYTFIGFSNEDQLNKAMKKSTLKLASINQLVFIYPYQIKNDDDDDKKDQKSKQNTDDFNVTDMDENEIIELMESLLNDSQEISDNLPKFIKYKNDDINFKTFIPEQNLIYCFFSEINPPNQQAINRKYKSIFGVNTMQDIQRFCYYPDTKNIYTFIGFSNEYQLKHAKKTLKSSALNNSIYGFPYEIKEIDEVKNESLQESSNQNNNFDQFEFNCNNDDLIKIYLSTTTTTTTTDDDDEKSEEQSPQITSNCEQLNNNDNKLNQINNFEIQSKSELNSNSNINNYDTTFYYKQPEDEKSNNTLTNQNWTNVPIKTFKPKTLQNNENKNGTFDSNKKQQIESFFEPDECLYYLYFKEKNNLYKNHQSHDVKLFGINDINDLQRGFRFNKTESDYFTFMGFIRSIDRSMAVVSLSENDEIITSSIQKYEDEDSSESSSSDDDDNEKEKVKTKNKTENINSNQTNDHENKVKSSTQNLNSQTQNENSLSKNDKQNETNEINTRFRFKPAENSIKKDEEIQKNIKLNETSEQQNTQNLINQTNESNKQQKETESIQLPPFMNYSQNKLNFKEFIPKDNHFYCFFSEINEPNYKSITRKYDTLFGYRFIPDIQRFCYYPGTKNIYTFLGFLDKKQQYLAETKYPLKTASFNGSIYAYPYKEFQTTNQNKSTTQIQNTTEKLNALSNTENLNQTTIKLDSNNSIPKESFQNSINIEKMNSNSSNQSSFEFKNESFEFTSQVLFHPNEDLFYIYFKERKNSIFLHQENDITLFGIQKIKNLQRGFKINPNDSDIYTFLGFDKAIEMVAAKNILLKQTEIIDTSSIQQFYENDDEDEDDSSSFDDYDDDENEEESDDYSTSNNLFRSPKISYNEKFHFE